MAEKMFAAVYGDEADVRALLESDVKTAGRVLIAADILHEEDMLNLNQALARGQTAGVAVHRALVQKREG